MPCPSRSTHRRGRGRFITDRAPADPCEAIVRAFQLGAPRSMNSAPRYDSPLVVLSIRFTFASTGIIVLTRRCPPGNTRMQPVRSLHADAAGMVGFVDQEEAAGRP